MNNITGKYQNITEGSWTQTIGLNGEFLKVKKKKKIKIIFLYIYFFFFRFILLLVQNQFFGILI